MMKFKFFLRKNWFGLLSVVVSFSILVSLAFSHRADLFASQNISFQFLFPTFINMILYCLLDSLVLFCLVKIKYDTYKFRQSLKTCVIGLFYSAITPCSIGGQPMQIIQMSQDKIKIGDSSSFIAIKMISYQVCMTLFSIVALFIGTSCFEGLNTLYIILLGLALNLVFISIIFLICIKKNLVIKLSSRIINFLSRFKLFGLKNPQQSIDKTIEQINLFHDSAKLISQKKSLVVILCLITFFQLMAYYSIPYFIFRCFNINCSFSRLLFATSIIYMITTFVPMPGASGANEFAFFKFFDGLLINSMAIPVIFVWRFITYYSLILIGGILIIIDMLRHKPF